MRRTTGCRGFVLAPTRMCELAIALLLLLLVSSSGRATARASERPELITEARLVSSTDISGPTMLRAQRLWHFIPADASVNVKDRVRVHFTFRCAPTGQDSTPLRW